MPHKNEQPSKSVSDVSKPTHEGKPVTVESTPSTVADAFLGTDPPIEQEHPGLQPALVFASYPLVLIVVISVVAMYFFFFRASPNESKTPVVQTESTK
jgi:hypothetical protein